MEEYDILTDSYSAEIIAIMILERMWAKVHNYMESKEKKREDKHTEKRLNELEGQIKVNTVLDKERARK